MADAPDPASTPEGDFEKLFTDLVEEHQVMIYRYARFLVRDARLAEEISQDTFVTAYTKLQQEAPHGDAGPWLRGITRNLVMRARTRGKARLLFCDDETLDKVEGFWVQNQSTPTSQPGPRIEALRKCMEALSEDDARLLKLRYEQKCSRQGIADQLSLSAEGVKTRLRRLRGRLAECVRRRLSGSGGPS